MVPISIMAFYKPKKFKRAREFRVHHAVVMFDQPVSVVAKTFDL